MGSVDIRYAYNSIKIADGKFLKPVLCTLEYVNSGFMMIVCCWVIPFLNFMIN